jgi:hypothetical protein
MMRKKILLVLATVFTSSVFAEIPYCPGTEVNGGKHNALQYVVDTFANENNCVIGSNCILNFDGIKYSIAWAVDCPGSAQRGNDPKGSTFICMEGQCYPYGFSLPSAEYQEVLR